MPDIKLNFINRSNARNTNEILIFQKNHAQNADALVVAWTVIQHCGRNDNHPFTYSMGNQLSAGDSWGNYTPQMNVENGDIFEMVNDSSENVLRLSEKKAPSSEEFILQNSLTQGSISANVYKNGKLLAKQNNLAPSEQAIFEMRPVIYIGVAAQVEEGDYINPAVVDSIETNISLLGIKSADIVMTGGGPGNYSVEFKFALENVVML